MASPATTTRTEDTWRDCVGTATWIEEPLRSTLGYSAPLPVQLAVVPTVARALLSGIPMDVSLTAPTGSGKTLCYLLPLLQLVTAEKKGLNDTQLRALVLVPTKALGQQVFRELTRLTRHTTIAVASLCNSDAVDSIAAEADMLVRRVRAATGPHDFGEYMCGVTEAHLSFGTDDLAAADSDVTAGATGPFHYFSKVDILVATPQRLLRHLDSTPGLSLASLRLLVIDEADQVLAGNFANFVVKVVERFEEEQGLRQRREQASRQRQHAHEAELLCTLGEASGVAASEYTARSGDGLWLSQRPTGGARGGHILHKMLCSATLSSRIGRISEVRLRNCQYFALGTDGAAVPQPSLTLTSTSTTAKAAREKGGSEAGPATVRTDFALPPTLREHIVFVEDSYRHAVLLKLVRTLLERIAAQQQAKRTRLALQAKRDDEGDDDDENESENEKEEKKGSDIEEGRNAAKEDGEKPAGASPHKNRHGSRALDASATYPEVDEDAGTGILIFCSSAEEARVMGHFLTAAGVRGVIEFTTLTSESERRRALLQHQQQHTGHSHDGSPSAHASLATPNVVVASDALMRGIDIPNTGHVIMYHSPESISQYVHRAGRTARAMRPGHLHVLLSKIGTSGTQADGEVAAFKKLSGLVSRTLPQVYERHFFLFAKAPEAPPAGTAATAADAEKDAKKKQRKEASKAGKKGETAVPDTEDPTAVAAAAAAEEKKAQAEKELAERQRADPKAFAEWWLEEANAYLAKSQQQLSVRWASALEAGEAASPTPAPAAAVGEKESGKKRRRSTSPTK